jgi:ribose 5-phosphate isomerase RpiB
MRFGIASSHGGFALKKGLVKQLRDGGHEVVEFGAYSVQTIGRNL